MPQTCSKLKKNFQARTLSNCFVSAAVSLETKTKPKHTDSRRRRFAALDLDLRFNEAAGKRQNVLKQHSRSCSLSVEIQAACFVEDQTALESSAVENVTKL